MNETKGEQPSTARWKEELRLYLETMRRAGPPMEKARDEHGRVLSRTLDEEVYPAFEEFLGEMTRHGIGGQIYGRSTGYAITLRLDDGFEVTVERDRYREQGQVLPRLIFVVYHERGGRQYRTTQGISWDRIKSAEVMAQVAEEYKRWYVHYRLARE